MKNHEPYLIRLIFSVYDNFPPLTLLLLIPTFCICLFISFYLGGRGEGVGGGMGQFLRRNRGLRHTKSVERLMDVSLRNKRKWGDLIFSCWETIQGNGCKSPQRYWTFDTTFLVPFVANKQLTTFFMTNYTVNTSTVRSIRFLNFFYKEVIRIWGLPIDMNRTDHQPCVVLTLLHLSCRSSWQKAPIETYLLRQKWVRSLWSLHTAWGKR